MAEGGERFPAMDLMRSEPMQLAQLMHLSVNLNVEKSPFQRTYALQIKRCGEMARRLRFFKEQMTTTCISPSSRSATSSDFNLDELELKLGDLEAELVEMNTNSVKLERSYNELLEYKLVMQKASEFFHSAQSSASDQHIEFKEYNLVEGLIDSPLLLEQTMSVDPAKQVKLGYVSGLVAREKSMAFERILFRATMGNVFVKQVAVDDAVTDPVSGEKVSVKLSELKTTIEAGQVHKEMLLKTISCKFQQWNLLVKKEKSVYHTLNLLSLDVTKKCLIGEGWCPVFATSHVQAALDRAALDCNSQVGTVFQVLHTTESPPTYFRTNKFTSAFQDIVEAYGQLIE